MRRALALVALATTAMVSLAFLLPLLLVVHQIARDRALTDAQRQADAMVAVLAVSSARDAVSRAVASNPAGARGALAVHLPAQPPLGRSRASTKDVALAASRGQSFTSNVDGGLVYLQAAALDQGRTAVVEVFVPQGDLSRGVAAGWWALTGVAIVLMAGSVLVADRLGARVVGATSSLATAAREFGGGDLRARVNPSGPPELVEAGTAFNNMADRVVQLLDAERELAADLSHRLRTPLTALRLDAEALDDGADARRMRQAVATLEREIDLIIRTARRPLSEREPEWCDMSEVVTDRLEFWSVLAEDEHRTWRLVGTDRRAPVAVSRGDVVAVLDGLLGNVFRHTQQGTAFAVAVQAYAGGVTLVVEDAGPGIPYPRRAVRRGTSGGGSTGLGLDIARRVVESTGGQLQIDRGVLGGARVRLQLLTPDRPAEAPWPMVGRSR